MSARTRFRNLAIRLTGPTLFVVASLWGFHTSDFDITIQDMIYDQALGSWPVSKSDQHLRLMFYDGPKIALFSLGAGLFIAFLFSLGTGVLFRWRRELAFMIVVLALTPALVALGKQVTNVYCPLKLERYGGNAPYVQLFDHYPDGFVQKKRGACFPAGHASGGFSLIALFFVLKPRSWRVFGLIPGLVSGWLMGGYQMLAGAHFLSHTIITMLLAWIVCILADFAILRKKRRRCSGSG